MKKRTLGLIVGLGILTVTHILGAYEEIKFLANPREYLVQIEKQNPREIDPSAPSRLYETTKPYEETSTHP